MEKLLCPSLLNLSDDSLKDEVQKLDRSGADILHLDVMDGDYVLVMTVNPGFAGRDYLSYVETKIKWLVEIRRQYGFHIVIDGGVTWEVLRRLWGYGVEGFVLGKQILFGQDQPYDQIIRKVRAV